MKAQNSDEKMLVQIKENKAKAGITYENQIIQQQE
jgi:hypothetical protein